MTTCFFSQAPRRGPPSADPGFLLCKGPACPHAPHNPNSPTPQTKKIPRTVRPARVTCSKIKHSLPGSHSSTGKRSEYSHLGNCSATCPDDQRRSRCYHRHSERQPDPHPGETRVRFEFAWRAHQRKCTPSLGINLAPTSCQEQTTYHIQIPRSIRFSPCSWVCSAGFTPALGFLFVGAR